MEKILKQFLIDDIIYNVLFDYLLPTEQYDDVIYEINDIGVDEVGYYLFHGIKYKDNISEHLSWTL